MAPLENFEPKMCFTILRKSVVFHMVQEIQKQISDYLVNFAKEHDLKYVQDDMNNVVIYKPANTWLRKRAHSHPSRDIWIWFVRNARKSNMIL